MTAKSAAFIARTAYQPLRFNPAGGAQVVDLSGGIVGVPVHQSPFIEGDVVDLSGFAAGAYSGSKTLTSESTDRLIAFAATFAAEKLTGLEFFTDSDLAHLYSGSWQAPGVTTYPVSTLPDEVGSLPGTITSTPWTSGVAPTTLRGLTYYHSTQAIEGKSNVGTMGKTPGVYTGIPGAKLDLSGVSWVDFPIAHVTRRNNPATTAAELILEYLESATIGYYVTPEGVVTLGQYLVDPFLLVADHDIPYSNVVPEDPAASWNDDQSPDPPEVLQVQFGTVSWPEDPAALLIGGDPDSPDEGLIRDRNKWRSPYLVIKAPIPNHATVFPLATADLESTARQSEWWATAEGARDEARRRAEIEKFRHLAVNFGPVGPKWLYAHPETGKTLLPFDVVQVTHRHAEHLEPGGVVKAILWNPVRDYGAITVRLMLRSIRMG